MFFLGLHIGCQWSVDKTDYKAGDFETKLHEALSITAVRDALHLVFHRALDLCRVIVFGSTLIELAGVWGVPAPTGVWNCLFFFSFPSCEWSENSVL